MRVSIDSKLETLFHRCSHYAVHRQEKLGGRNGALVVLHRLGPMSQRALAENLNVRAATLSEQIGKLEEAGLVRRETNEKDRRSVIVSLTDEGKDYAKKLSRERNKRSKKLYSCLSDEEKQQLLVILEKLSANWD